MLVHGDEVGDRIVGIMGGYIRWAGSDRGSDAGDPGDRASRRPPARPVRSRNDHDGARAALIERSPPTGGQPQHRIAVQGSTPVPAGCRAAGTGRPARCSAAPRSAGGSCRHCWFRCCRRIRARRPPCHAIADVQPVRRRPCGSTCTSCSSPPRTASIPTRRPGVGVPLDELAVRDGEDRVAALRGQDVETLVSCGSRRSCRARRCSTSAGNPEREHHLARGGGTGAV